MNFLVRSTRGLSALLILGGVFFFVYNAMAARAVIQKFQTKTGTQITYTHFERGLFSSKVTASNVKVYRPADEGGALLLDVPQVYAHLNRKAWRNGIVRFEELHLTINTLHLSNPEETLQWIQSMLKGQASGEKKFEGIDRLVLSWDKIKIKENGETVTIKVGLRQEECLDVNSVKDLSPLMFKMAPKNSWRNMARLYSLIQSYAPRQG
jgi:hypothetical protein